MQALEGQLQDATSSATHCSRRSRSTPPMLVVESGAEGPVQLGQLVQTPVQQAEEQLTDAAAARTPTSTPT